MNQQLLSIGEAASLLNVHPETLRRWDREGVLTAIKVNDRGDRRYKQADIQEFLGSNSELVKYNQNITYKDYSIIWASQGFFTPAGNFDLIAKIILRKEDKYIYTAFYVSLLEKYKRSDREENLDDIAIKHIKNFIDEEELSNDDMHTFEFFSGSFIEIENPEWWEGKYSKRLSEGLKAEVGSTYPTSLKNQAWRVIIKFKSQESDYWVYSRFGEQHNLHEYFVWIDSKELIAKGLPPTAKGAEIIAMNFIINRFNETKDPEGVRNITRITENNAACYGGTCIKDKLLPNELME